MGVIAITPEEKIFEQLRQVQGIMHRTAFQGFQEYSSYHGQGRVLRILSQRPEISRKELGERMGISRQGLVELLGKLEKSGLIVRESSAVDRRAAVIKLTEQGRAAAADSAGRTHPLAGMLDCLTEEEQAALSGYLTRILTACKQEPAEHCFNCTGPETCSRDYLKYGHTKPNEKYCKYIHEFTDFPCGEADSD